MELEDQKPKDIILNEEIKQEKEESLESFKEERLAEDEYFELITPKLKEVNGSSAVRMESEEQKSKNTLWDREIKQETDDFLENAKEEPIEEKYSEQTMAKLEEVREQSTSVMSNNPMQSFFIVPQEDFPKLDVEPPIEAIARFQKSNSYPPQVNRQINPVQKLFMLNVVPKLDVESERDQGEMHVERKNKNDFGFQNSRCSVCFQFCCRQNMKYVSMEEDKLVIMIGCVLLETYTLVQAQSFMSDERRRIRICYVHFSEAVNEIYNVLNIKNPYEISSCSSELMDTLLVTVNALYPQTGTVQFRHIIYNFVRRNISRKPINTKGELNKKQQNYHCSLCSRKQNFQNVKQVTLETEKLLIMIGCILRGEYSFEEAHSFIFRTKCSVICHIHFPEVLNEIYKALNIKNPDEVSSCSTELLTNLMITINRLCPQFELWQLRVGLMKFFTRNKHIFRIAGRD